MLHKARERGQKCPKIGPHCLWMLDAHCPTWRTISLMMLIAAQFTILTPLGVVDLRKSFHRLEVCKSSPSPPSLPPPTQQLQFRQVIYVVNIQILSCTNAVSQQHHMNYAEPSTKGGGGVLSPPSNKCMLGVG